MIYYFLKCWMAWWLNGKSSYQLEIHNKLPKGNLIYWYDILELFWKPSARKKQCLRCEEGWTEWTRLAKYWSLLKLGSGYIQVHFLIHALLWYENVCNKKSYKKIMKYLWSWYEQVWKFYVYWHGNIFRIWYQEEKQKGIEQCEYLISAE